MMWMKTTMTTTGNKKSSKFDFSVYFCTYLNSMKIAYAKILIFTLLIAASTQKLWSQTPSVIICKGSSVNFREFNTGSSEPSVGWEWTFEGGTPGTSTLREPSIQYPNAGLFKASCVSIFQSGTRDTNAAYVLVIDGTLAPIPMRDTIICSPNINLILDAGNPSQYNQYIWSSPDVTLKPGDTLQKLTATKAGTYKVRVQNICAFSEKIITVRQGVRPTVDLGGDRFVCRNISIILDAGFTAGNTYSWVPTGENSASITANTAGNYKVTVTSPDGCTATDDVNLIDSCPPVVWLPTAFTPNAAAPNDIYTPYIEGFKYMKMMIFNRWGEKLYEQEGLNQGWDGTFMGEICPDGFYIVHLELIGNDTFRKIKSQSFMLLK